MTAFEQIERPGRIHLFETITHTVFGNPAFTICVDVSAAIFGMLGEREAVTDATGAP